jgi:hypothetical protein
MNFFIVLVIAHLLGDYVFQPYKLSEKKKEKIVFVILHSIIYSVIVFIFLNLIYEFVYSLQLAAIVLISHFIIDILRIIIDRKLAPSKHFYSFIADQVLHLVIIYILSQQFPALKPVGEMVSIDYKNATIVLAYLMVLSPASVFIKHFFNMVYKNDLCVELEEDNNRVGSLIGILERLVVVTLGILNLYTAIALVFTAKSIARFKQLEEKTFAERYLIGTLLSFLIAILGLLIIKNT